MSLIALLAHEGHEATTWLHRIGYLHPALVHYPIALIIFALVAELIYSWKKDIFYRNAGDFMLIAGAILIIPTALTGWAFALQMYDETIADNLFWHIAFAIASLIVLLGTIFLRYRGSRTAYLISLVILAILISLTAFHGGEMVYGAGHLF